jgi:hypothetical protein
MSSGDFGGGGGCSGVGTTGSDDVSGAEGDNAGAGGGETGDVTVGLVQQAIIR